MSALHTKIAHNKRPKYVKETYKKDPLNFNINAPKIGKWPCSACRIVGANSAHILLTRFGVG